MNPEILARPRCLETRTERVFPHSHSDCGGGAVPFFREIFAAIHIFTSPSAERSLVARLVLAKCSCLAKHSVAGKR
jgi:hypothetical protein